MVRERNTPGWWEKLEGSWLCKALIQAFGAWMRRSFDAGRRESRCMASGGVGCKAGHAFHQARGRRPSTAKHTTSGNNGSIRSPLNQLFNIRRASTTSTSILAREAPTAHGPTDSTIHPHRRIPRDCGQGTQLHRQERYAFILMEAVS
jgi:hypothetical protein